ncbi:MAG: SMI1/KNR4 family protein [Ruminococcus sp.]|nr:SMI1/KNR4 family protein [Ruminococcus sp.]
MKIFENMDIEPLFDNDSDWGKKHNFPAPSAELIKRAEENIGYKLPGSYLNFLELQNGGYIKYFDCWCDGILGISEDPKEHYGLEFTFRLRRNEWEDAPIGVPIGYTQSGGHDMYYLDYRKVDENGEPRVVRMDNEGDNAIYSVAANFTEFIRNIIERKAIRGRRIK